MALRRIETRHVAGALVLLIGVTNVLSVLRPGLFHRVEFLADVLPGGVVSASAAVSVAVGVLLIGLALNLSRGKRRAWRITVGLLVFELLLQATHPHPIVIGVTAVLLALLVSQRNKFIGRSEPVGRSRALAVGGLLLAASTVLGWLAVTALDQHLGTGLSPADRLLATVQGFVGIESAVTSGSSRDADAVYYLLVALAGTTVLVTGGLILRAPRVMETKSDDDDNDLRTLIRTHGAEDSLAYFALRDDRPVLWGPGRRAAISYRAISGTMLAAGDPIGPQSAWPEAITAFVEHARANSAVPAVVASTEAGARAWTKHAGLVALEFGDEAVLSAATFTLEGRAMRNTRQAVTRAQKSGCTVTCARLRDVAPDQVEHLADLADLWRGGAIERGFSMALGRLDVARDPDAVIVTAELEGTTQAMLLLVPWGGSHRLSLDVMRRSSSAISGVNELMNSELMTWATELGVSEVSLNFAVFREAIERAQRIGAGPIARMWGAVLQGASRLTQVDTLYRFNAKFCPEWRSRYLLYPRAGGLPRVTWAYLRAESFLPQPLHARRLRRGTAGAATGSGAVLSDLPPTTPSASARQEVDGPGPTGNVSRRGQHPADRHARPGANSPE